MVLYVYEICHNSTSNEFGKNVNILAKIALLYTHVKVGTIGCLQNRIYHSHIIESCFEMFISSSFQSLKYA